MRSLYICPLGEGKFSVDKLKFNQNNLEMLKFIEMSKQDDIFDKTKKIAEDDEYEYYVEK